MEPFDLYNSSKKVRVDSNENLLGPKINSEDTNGISFELNEHSNNSTASDNLIENKRTKRNVTKVFKAPFKQSKAKVCDMENCQYCTIIADCNECEFCLNRLIK